MLYSYAEQNLIRNWLYRPITSALFILSTIKSQSTIMNITINNTALCLPIYLEEDYKKQYVWWQTLFFMIFFLYSPISYVLNKVVGAGI